VEPGSEEVSAKNRFEEKPIRQSLILCAGLLLVLQSLCPSLAAPAQGGCPAASVKSSVKTDALPDGRIMVPVSLENHPLSLLVDTGGVSTTVKWDQAKALGLAVKQSTRKLLGVAGAALNFVVASENFSIGELHVKNRPIFVESRPLPFSDGTLAPDILRDYDVDIDFPGGSFSLIAPEHCATGAAVVAMDVAQNGHVRFPVKIDGATIIATLDTGSATSLVSMRTAALLGVYPTSPELTLLRNGGPYRLYAYPFQELEIGRIAVKNPHIVIASDNFTQGLGSDLILGVDALRQMHLTIAYGDKRLYISGP
jgi:predicted aspartyl protease